MVAASTCRSSRIRSPTYRFSRLFARSWGWTAFSALLPAPGGRTEGCEGTDARRHETNASPKGPSPGGEGLSFVCHELRAAMTIRTDPSKPPSPATKVRRSHVPGDGSVHASAVEQARKDMLHE